MAFMVDTNVAARRVLSADPQHILVDTYGVIGRQVYDTRIVAVMHAYNITHLLTVIPTHFRRFANIAVVEPKDVR